MPILFLGCEDQIDQELATLAKTPDLSLLLSPFQSYDNPVKFTGKFRKTAVGRPLKLSSSGTITIEPCMGRCKDLVKNHDSGEGHNDGQNHDSEGGHNDGQNHDSEGGHDEGQHEGEGKHGGRYYVLVEGSGNGTHLGLFTVEITYCTDGVNPFTDITGIQTAANGDQLFMTLVGAGEEPGHGTYQDYMYHGGTGRFENATGNIRMYGYVDPVKLVWELEGEGTLTY